MNTVLLSLATIFVALGAYSLGEYILAQGSINVARGNDNCPSFFASLLTGFVANSIATFTILIHLWYLSFLLFDIFPDYKTVLLLGALTWSCLWLYMLNRVIATIRRHYPCVVFQAGTELGIATLGKKGTCVTFLDTFIE